MLNQFNFVLMKITLAILVLMCFSLVIDANSVNRLVDVQCVDATSGEGIDGVSVSAYTIGTTPSLVSRKTTNLQGRCQLSVPVNSSYDFKAQLGSEIQTHSNVAVSAGITPFELDEFRFE